MRVEETADGNFTMGRRSLSTNRKSMGYISKEKNGEK